jgi:DNA-binding NarL/FixJ family response regulator
VASFRILIVDDSEPWRRMVFTLLREYLDWQIICEASDGLEAVQKSKELQPDLILLDIALPGLNGIEAARQIYETAPRSRILFLSENLCPEVVREALCSGARGYVAKSDAAQDLMAAVEAVIGDRHFVSNSVAGCATDRPLDAHVLQPRVRHTREGSSSSSPTVHSRNSDGTTTSVCNRCPLTIGRALDENDLAELESRHVCQSVERRQMVCIVHRTYIPPVGTDRRLGGSSRKVLNGDGWILSQAAKVELIKAHLFLHPCSRCKTSAEYLSPNDERVCFRCQFSSKRRWKELSAVAPLPTKDGELNCCHEVQLYSSDEVFVHRFTRFIGAALRLGDAVVVIATQSHRDAIFQRLLADSLEVAVAVDQGRYIPLDVADTLSTLMINDLPDPVRFLEAAGSLLGAAKKAARGKHPHVSACGECAPFLWREGMADAAVRLEELWDEIARRESVDTLCGYPGESFRCEQGGETLQRIIGTHSALHVW